jgi:hypothetical protein
MMCIFLSQNREELIRRCAVSVSKRPHRHATESQLRNGIPLFLAQLERTLEAEERHYAAESLRISGAPGGDASGNVSEMSASAAIHGRQLLDLEFTVGAVVHDYGDLCQAITNLAFERNAPFTVGEFRSLNRCLDNAIASAVASFSTGRDISAAAQHTIDVDARVAARMHELQSSLATATYAVAAMDTGNLPMSGSTGRILKRSLAAMRDQIGGPTLEEVQSSSDSRL